MRVGFDEQIFLLQQQGGISRYFRALVQALVVLDPPDVEPVLLGLRTPHPVLAKAARGWHRVRPPRRTTGLDLVHRTFYHPAWLDDDPEVPLVITVYDMIPEESPDEVPPGVHRSKREYVDRASLILTISESTKAELLRHFGTPAAPVVVTPLGVGAEFRNPPAGVITGLPERYLVFVGHRGGYKDFAVALAALAHLPTPLHLVAVGGGPWTTEESHTIDRLGLVGRVHRLDLDDRGLAAAYRGASAAVVPSRHEGFGLPVLEAMAAGAPVVAARAGSLPEVGGTCAAYFAPGDPTDLARVLSAVPSGGPDRDALTAAGRAHADGFTWRRTAELTAAAYRSLLAER